MSTQATPGRRHPEWIRVRVPGGEGYARTRAIVKASGVATVAIPARAFGIPSSRRAANAT